MARTQVKPQQDGQDDEKVKDRPVKVIRLRNIRGNVWGNRTKDGRSTFYTVTFDRIWKEDDEVGGDGRVTKKGEWHQSPSYGTDDLLLLGKVADLCHTWINNQLQDRNQGY